MKRIIIFSLVAFVVWGVVRLAVAKEGNDGPLEKGVVVRLIPVTTAVENGTVRMTAKLKLINKMDVGVSDIQVVASAGEQVQVSPEAVTVDYIAAGSEFFVEELITVVSPQSNQQEDNVARKLVWMVDYNIAESEVTKEDTSAMPSSSMATKRFGRLQQGIRINEIMFCPADPNTQNEWVELYNDSDDKAIDIAGYELCNASGSIYRLPEMLPPVPPGAFVLVVFDGQDATENDVSFEDDNLAILYVGERNVFADEGDVCILFAGKPHSRSTIRGFVTWGDIRETLKDKNRPKKAKAFMQAAVAKGLWKRGAVRVFTSVPKITGPTAIVKKGGSLVLRDSDGRKLASAGLPCPPEEVTPGWENVLPPPQLWLPRDELRTSADLFTFSWLPVGLSTYQFQICKEAKCTDLIIDANGLSDPFFQPTLPLDKNATYYWRVRSITDDNVSSWSEIRKFTIGYPEGTASFPLEDSYDTIVLETGANPLGVVSRAARKDSSLLCVDDCDKAHWDSSNETGPQDGHSTWYCWAAAAQMLAWYRGGNLLKDEIVVTVKGGAGTEPEDSLPHGAGAGATQAEDYHAVRYALQATQAQLHEQAVKPSGAQLKAFIDADRPLWYENVGHAMIIDGYRTVGGVREARFLNTDNNGTIGWRPWNAEPFRWCLVPEAGLTGRTADSRMTTDSDSDGMMDFDEDERFPTDKMYPDTEWDGVPDKADVASYALRGIGADADTDGLRGEEDPDSDNGGLQDGLEDLDHDGEYEPANGEKDPHNPADDLAIDIDLVLVIDTTNSMTDDIAAAKAAAVDIVNAIDSKAGNYRIAVASFEDFPYLPYGDASCGDYMYHDVLDFCDNNTVIVGAINSLSLRCGKDQPESHYSALVHCLDKDALGGWRNGVAKVAILMSDAPPHDPEPNTGYTAADVVQAATDLDPAVIYPILIGGDAIARPYYEFLADETGGKLFEAADATEVVAALIETIETVFNAPIALADGPYWACVGDEITFDASASYDPDGDIVLYEWDLDDDGVYDIATSAATTTYAYSSAYSGPVKLRVRDNDALFGFGVAFVEVGDTIPPVVDAGLNIIVEQETWDGTTVTLNGLALDNCDDELDYEWSENGTVLGNSATLTHTFNLGTHALTLEATDDFGNVGTDTVTVTVVDTTPPTINSVSADPSVLWPPNHKMVEVTITVDAEDICDPAHVCQIVDVTSNEPINGLGDGDTAPDWEITSDLTVNLRAERAGVGTGRLYTIHIECTDASGNTATATVEVTVPHDQDKGKGKGKK